VPVPDQHLSARQLLPYFQQCGYGQSSILENIALPGTRFATLAGFAQRPFDTRSACFAAMDVVTTPENDAKACRNIGAPLTFLCHQGELLWWSQTGHDPYQIGGPIPPNRLDNFFVEHKNDFAPKAIYRAKTLGRFEKQYQLSFVDIGLMPLVEREVGQAIERLLLDSVSQVRDMLGWPKVLDLKPSQWLVKSVFWLLGAKMLHDKEVENFIRLNFSNVNDVFDRVAKHYGDSAEGLITSRAKQDALETVAKQIYASPNLQLATTESLAFVYENTLISKEVRSEFGTHSTPSFLVDYIVGRLEPWIQDIDLEKRSVFEPGCGHGAFLIAATRLLTSLLPPDKAEPATRKKYLRDRICGYDVDEFAVEIARLSLTLTDIPNSNGWMVKSADLFESDLLEKAARRSTILLANPPFEDFKPMQRTGYARKFQEPQFVNKAAEMLGRALSALPTGGVFGVVVSENFLYSKNSKSLRQKLANEFELEEVCQFPDRVFNFAKKESAVLIGRKIGSNAVKSHALCHYRIRVHGMDAFKQRYEPSCTIKVLQTRFSPQNDWDFRVPELEQIWTACSKLPTFDQYAEIGQGFSHIGRKDLSPSRKTTLVAEQQFQNAVRGFVAFDHHLQTHQVPQERWVNIDPKVISRPRSGIRHIGNPQVLLNYAPIQAAPWCLKALQDNNGRAVNSRFLTIWPRDAKISLEALWAISNSPFTNAYAFTHSTKREILAGMLREMRVPELSDTAVSNLTTAVRIYFDSVAIYENPIPLRSDDDRAKEREQVKLLHWRIDAEVLRLYALSAELERELLDFFTNWERAGVPFKQTHYFPEGFDEAISLADFLAITTDWQTTNKDRLKLIEKKATEGISVEDKNELNKLQRLAGLKRELLSSPSLRELSQMEMDLQKKGLWRGA
jgi:hypothetical protein